MGKVSQWYPSGASSLKSRRGSDGKKGFMQETLKYVQSKNISDSHGRKRQPNLIGVLLILLPVGMTVDFQRQKSEKKRIFLLNQGVAKTRANETRKNVSLLLLNKVWTKIRFVGSFHFSLSFSLSLHAQSHEILQPRSFLPLLLLSLSLFFTHHENCGYVFSQAKDWQNTF